jgi:predicted ATPase/class 3 adenylate cyclase
MGTSNYSTDRPLPTGTVTFLFTDIEGSTKLAQQYPDQWNGMQKRHHLILSAAIESHNGFVFQIVGDSFATSFHTANDALDAALEAQRSLHNEAWSPAPVKVRMGIHTGAAQLNNDALQTGYTGYTTLASTQRIMSAGHGGQILLSQTAADLAHDKLPAGVYLRDMGEQRLKDMLQPEHIYQLTASDLPCDFAPLATMEIINPNLPAQLTAFIGRETELASIKALLSDAHNRLITIVAPGGTGKTRLAIQTAAQVSSDYTDGVFFVGFADIVSNDDIIQTVAESLGVALSGDEDTKTQLLTYLAPRRQLLVLDNLEHLDGAAAIIAEILKTAPNVKVVATSRSKLNLTGETVLSPAGLDTTWDRPEEAMQASGAQLFIVAAKRSNGTFVIKNDDLDALAEILHLVEGMPLGILLAAAWVDMLSIREIAAEIRRSFNFLETDMQDVPARQRSVRAVFDSSWRLLSHQEQDTFAALSVFRGGFSREAAEGIAGASLRSLASLVSKSLLTANPNTRRYEVHELLRQYAAAELEKDHDRFQKICDSHAAFYADVMGESPSLMTHGKQAELIDMIEQDIENIRSAWRHLIDTPNARRARKFVLGLWMLYEFRGWYSASIALFNDALQLLPEDPDDEDITALRALASAVKGWSLALLSQPKAAVIATTGPTKLLARSSNFLDYWIAAQCSAIALVYNGSVEEMAAELDEAIKCYEPLDEKFWVASLKNWRAFAAVAGADLGGATRFAAEANELLRSGDEYWVTVWNLWLGATIANHENRPDDAIDLYAEQVARCRKISYVRGMMVSLEGLGEANVAAGRLDAAEQAFIEGIAAAEQMGMVRDMLNMMIKVAKVWGQRGQLFEAVELLATVLAEPTSIHRPFTDAAPINQAASAALSELEKELDPEAYASAFARGSERPYVVAAEQLIGNNP